MIPEPLNLQLEEPGDNLLSDQVFDTLRKILQPYSTVPVDFTAAQISELLPKGRLDSSEVGWFLQTCYEVAEQIPYDHPSMVELGTIVDLVLNSSRFPKVDGTCNTQTDPTLRYARLGATLRDWWDTSSPDDFPDKYVNFQAFVAHTHERIFRRGALMPIWILQVVFEERWQDTRKHRDAYVKAALQYLLLFGDEIYRVAKGDAAKRYNWPHWREQVGAVAAEDICDKACVYGSDTIDMARRAVVAMDAHEPFKMPGKKPQPLRLLSGIDYSRYCLLQ